VGIFSATRRLSRDGDPTQPALDSKLTGQGSSFVFDPQAEVANSFDNRYGITTLNLQGSGFIYVDNSRYNHGALRAQIKQAFNPETSLLLRYYYSPDLFLGDNEERQTGTLQIVGENVTSHIWSTRLTQEITPGSRCRWRAGDTKHSRWSVEWRLQLLRLDRWRELEADEMGQCAS
jgi:hypothetical protein